MKKKYFLLLIILMTSIVMLQSSSESTAQQNKVDSLFTVLKQQNQTPDTVTINTLNALSKEFADNDPDTAIYFGRKALELATKLGYKMGIADACLWKGKSFRNLGEYDSSLKNNNYSLQLYNQLLSSESTSDRSTILIQKALTYNSLGLTYWKKANYPEALKNHYASLEIRKETGDQEGIAGSYNNIGLICFNQGNYREALKNYFYALRIIKRTGNKNFEANITGNIGNIFYEQGNYPAALKNHFAALKIAEEIGYKQGIATSYFIIGNIYETQGDYDESLKNHFAALKIEKEIGDKQIIATVYVNIGGVYGNKKNYPEALKHLLTSLKIFEELGDKKGTAASNMNIGIIYDHQGNYPAALKNYFSSLKMQEEIKDKTDIASALINIGRVYIKQKEYRKASEFLNKGLLIAKELSNANDIKDSYISLATLDSSQGNFEQAFAYYKLFIANRDSLFNEENTKKIVQSQMQYEFDKKEAATKADQDKKDILSVAQFKRQKLIKNTVLGGVGIAGIFVFLSVRSFNRRKKISFEKTVSEVEMKALRSQMNPHFISNSLQSINNYIINNEKENASEYLSRFSKLIRLILENSREQEITIEKDLYALDLYLQLESLRFKFDYTIEVSKDIDPGNTLIPPLLLQPFVENSILHGIRSADHGVIRIKIDKEDTMIRCTVEDNGIGREQSVVIETGEQKKRESLGMKITLERLAVINQLKKVKAAINVIDLRNNNNTEQGLRVELVLPYELAF